MARRKETDQRPRDAYYDVPPEVPAELIQIGRELARLEESARWSSQCQFEQSKFWRGWNWKLGIPSVLFGTASGATVLGDYGPDYVVGMLALAGAAFAGVLTTLAPERRSDRSSADGNAFHDIQVEARQMLLVDLVAMQADEARKRLTDLTERYAEIRRGADPTLRLAYDRAGNNIREGGQTFGIDEPKNA